MHFTALSILRTMFNSSTQRPTLFDIVQCSILYDINLSNAFLIKFIKTFEQQVEDFSTAKVTVY